MVVSVNCLIESSCVWPLAISVEHVLSVLVVEIRPAQFPTLAGILDPVY